MVAGVLALHGADLDVPAGEPASQSYVVACFSQSAGVVGEGNDDTDVALRGVGHFGANGRDRKGVENIACRVGVEPDDADVFAAQPFLDVGHAHTGPSDADAGGVEVTEVGPYGNFGPPSGFACRADDFDGSVGDFRDTLGKSSTQNVATLAHGVAFFVVRIVGVDELQASLPNCCQGRNRSAPPVGFGHQKPHWRT